jgi:hypothetical protein
VWEYLSIQKSGISCKIAAAICRCNIVRKDEKKGLAACASTMPPLYRTGDGRASRQERGKRATFMPTLGGTY